MCGILGVLARSDSGLSPKKIFSMSSTLSVLSESRGKEASGFAFCAGGSITVYKRPVPSSEMIRSKSYKSVFESIFTGHGQSMKKPINQPFSLIGHSRLVTNGLQTSSDNNQPVIKDGIVGIHNGIIANVDDIWKSSPNLKRKYDVDTEVVLSLVRQSLGDGLPLPGSVQKAYSFFEGSASVALFFEDYSNLILATDNGSLYYCMSNDGGVFIFASEKYILSQFTRKIRFRRMFSKSSIMQLRPGYGKIIDLTTLGSADFSLRQETAAPGKKVAKSVKASRMGDTRKAGGKPVEDVILPKKTKARITEASPREKAVLPTPKHDETEDKKLLFDVPPSKLKVKRCTRCVLPETFPFIDFDENGVCNYCRAYKPQKLKGVGELKKELKRFRSEDGEPDCIVGFSGGRDSSYGLSFIKNELNMHPIGYTYDWGMVTDLARRNCARICGKEGIEHIIVSADIKKKREYVKKNILAWLKRPDLGMVPLFMAGDKEFLYYAHILRKQTNTKLFIFCAGTAFEATDFKLGFCGVRKGLKKNLFMTLLPPVGKIKMLLYYLKQYILNPSYINASLWDTLKAYYFMYMLRDDYLYLFQYIDWNEKKIIDSLRKEYGWELAEDTKATWRIGDGTASFYNYIYYTVAGFSESDTFRSNQVRAGVLTREEAMKLIDEENKPRYESLRWYCDVIGIDFRDVITKINSIPKKFKV